MLNVLDLFTGLGGFSFGLEATGGFKTVAFCEFDDWLAERLKNWHPETPVFKDVKTITGEFHGSVDVICGGDPCQPHSVAGKRKGVEDARYLWPAMFTCVKKYRPSWVIRENVRGNINNGILDAVELDLESEGYACRTYLLPAYAVGAPHERFRTWTIAYSAGKQFERDRGGVLHEQKRRDAARGREDLRREDWEAGADITRSDGKALADSNNPRSQGWDSEVMPERSSEWTARPSSPFVAHPSSGVQCSVGSQCDEWEFQEKVLRASKYTHDWKTESGICRVVDGLPNRVQRLRALGNSIVPQIAEAIGLAILAANMGASPE